MLDGKLIVLVSCKQSLILNSRLRCYSIMIYEPVLVEMKNYLNNGMGLYLFAKHVTKQTATIIQHYDCCHICTNFFPVLFSQGKFHILKNQRIPMLQFSLVITYSVLLWYCKKCWSTSQ